MLKVFKTELKWAVIIAIIQLLWLVLEFALGFHNEFIAYHPYVSLLFYVPVILIIYYAIKENKEGLYGGQIDLMKGIKTGFFTSLFAVPLMAIINYLFFSFISPDFFTLLIKEGVKNGFKREALEDLNTLSNYLRQLIFFPSMGLLFALFSSLILKNK